MHTRPESRSGLESKLAKSLLADLIEREANDYVSIEIVREPSELTKTHRFRRKPDDDIRTTPFIRESASGLRSMPVDERGTVQYVKYSAPYEKIEVEEKREPTAPVIQIDVWESGQFISSSELFAIDDEPAELVASSNLIADVPAGDTLVDIEVAAIATAAAPSPAWFRPVLVIALLAGAFAIGLGVPFLL